MVRVKLLCMSSQPAALTSDRDPNAERDGGEPQEPSQWIPRHELNDALPALSRQVSGMLFSDFSSGLEVGFRW